MMAFRCASILPLLVTLSCDGDKLVRDAAAPDASAAVDLSLVTSGDAGDIDASSLDASDLGDALWMPAACSYYVAATGGSDTNPGTRAHPFATLAGLRTKLRTATGKVGCLRAGTYTLKTPFTLSHGLDDGETWQSDPADGVNTAVIDGTGVATCLMETNANDLTIDGLRLQNVLDNLTCHDDGKTTITNLTITNCDAGYNTAGSGSGGFPPCLMANGVDGATVTHNYVHDCASEGIGLFAYQSGLVLDHVEVRDNVVLRAVQHVPDGGAIYLQILNNYTAASIDISDNFVRDYGTAQVPNAHGVYLDEGTNHAVVHSNVIGASTSGSSQSTGCLIADGHDNQFSNNVCDLGSSGVAWSGAWWYPGKELFTPAHNSYTGNVVVSHFTGMQNTDAYQETGFSFVQHASPAGDPKISGNIYHNYGGGQVRTDGNQVSDASPVLADPLCSGALYELASDSPAFDAPVDFHVISGSWGPPGFAVPTNDNHSCP